MPATSTDVVNEALMLIGGNQALVTGVAPTFDSSAAGKAASVLYTPTVQAVGRQFGWDFARNTVALQLTGNVAPVPWTYEYRYPANGIQVWQLVPSVITDPNDPLPVNYVQANVLVANVQTRVIHSNLQNALAVYNNAPSEATWDALFRQAVVRLLASGLAMALDGKPDLAMAALKTGAAFGAAGETREN